jgi:hypothetical protein
MHLCPVLWFDKQYKRWSTQEKSNYPRVTIDLKRQSLKKAKGPTNKVSTTLSKKFIDINVKSSPGGTKIFTITELHYFSELLKRIERKKKSV